MLAPPALFYTLPLRGWSRACGGSIMLATFLVLLAVGGVAAGCLYTPDANGHVVVPAGVTSIGNEVFYGCVSVVSIALPEGLISIGYWAFYGATSLASVSFPESLISIGNSAFYGATSLASATFSEGLTSIGTQAFHNTLLAEADVTLPASLGEEKRHWYFYNCGAYTDLILPEGISTIDASAFSTCDTLLSVALPNSLISIGGVVQL
eukprot:scaffold92991_cov69-Phaeocystis_antarctica.AAC.1